jgi:hypothetical protein
MFKNETNVTVVIISQFSKAITQHLSVLSGIYSYVDSLGSKNVAVY